MVQQRIQCYCAYCRTKRKVYKSKYLNHFGVLGIIIFSYVLTLAIWDQTDIRGLFILGLCLLLAEGFTQLRWRQSMICHNCGFDPVIYVKDKNLASVKIKDFMKMRDDDPKYILKPLLPLQKQKSNQQATNQQSTKNIKFNSNEEITTHSIKKTSNFSLLG